MTRSIAPYFVTLVVFVTDAARGDKPVDVIVGESQFFNADHIRIRSVKSSGKGFEIGATVTVKGVYTLNSVETADLCFYSTTTLKPGEHPNPTPIQDGQRIKAQKGKHRFTLSKVIREAGSPHLTFYHPMSGKPFGGVYFGDRSNVLMKKSWSYDVPEPTDALETPVQSLHRWGSANKWKITIEGPFDEYGYLSSERWGFEGTHSFGLRLIKFDADKHKDGVFVGILFKGEEDPDRVMDVALSVIDKNGICVAQRQDVVRDPRIAAKEQMARLKREGEMETILFPDFVPVTLSLNFPKGIRLPDIGSLQLGITEYREQL